MFFVDNAAAAWVLGAVSLVIVVIVTGDLASDRRADDQTRDAGTITVFFAAEALAVAGSLTAALAWPASRLPGGWNAFGPGLALLSVGIVVNRWARHTLGTLYRPVVTIVEDHRIVTAGPYRTVRHPMYTGSCLMCLGIGLMMGTWIGLAIWVVPIGALVHRIKVEEQVLEDALGDSYRAFGTTRRRLLPGIW